MDYVEGLQVLLVLVRQHVVHLLQPRERRVVTARRQGVEVRYDVIALDDGVQEGD